MAGKVLVRLSDVVAAVFEGGYDNGHPCGQCTVCLDSIPEGTRYTTWEFRTSSGHVGIEHICMEGDWGVRQLMYRRNIISRSVNQHLTS